VATIFFVSFFLNPLVISVCVTIFFYFICLFA
jgi:hypothetical protein